MNKDIMTEWVAALRSGDYKQAHGRLGLRADGQESYCCLGVLCDIATKHGIVEKIEDRDFIKFKVPGDTLYAESAVLPRKVVAWADLLTTKGYDNLGKGQIDDQDESEQDIALPLLNDSGYDFQQIALIIEAQNGVFDSD